MKFKPFVYLLIASNFFVTFAQGCLGDADHPTAVGLACVFENIITIIMVIVGLVFAAAIAYGAIKLATSFGDPKGLAGAQLHWQYALIGLGVVVGVLAIFSIVSNILGIGTLNPFTMGAKVSGQIQSLIDFSINGTGQ